MDSGYIDMWGKKIPGRRTTKRTGILEESTTSLFKEQQGNHGCCSKCREEERTEGLGLRECKRINNVRTGRSS